MNPWQLLALARYWTRGPERAPIGTPPASIEVLLAPSTKRARVVISDRAHEPSEVTDACHE